jgi:hypothetical protein
MAFRIDAGASEPPSSAGYEILELSPLLFEPLADFASGRWRCLE